MFLNIFKPATFFKLLSYNIFQYLFFSWLVQLLFNKLVEIRALKVMVLSIVFNLWFVDLIHFIFQTLQMKLLALSQFFWTNDTNWLFVKHFGLRQFVVYFNLFNLLADVWIHWVVFALICFVFKSQATNNLGCFFCKWRNFIIIFQLCWFWSRQYVCSRGRLSLGFLVRFLRCVLYSFSLLQSWWVWRIPIFIIFYLFIRNYKVF